MWLVRRPLTFSFSGVFTAKNVNALSFSSNLLHITLSSHRRCFTDVLLMFFHRNPVWTMSEKIEASSEANLAMMSSSYLFSTNLIPTRTVDRLCLYSEGAKKTADGGSRTVLLIKHLYLLTGSQRFLDLCGSFSRWLRRFHGFSRRSPARGFVSSLTVKTRAGGGQVKTLVFGATRSTPTVSATIGESNFMDANNTSELIRRSRNSNKYIL